MGLQIQLKQLQVSKNSLEKELEMQQEQYERSVKVVCNDSNLVQPAWEIVPYCMRIIQLCENEQKNLVATLNHHSKEREELNNQILVQEKTVSDVREALNEKSSRMEGTSIHCTSILWWPVSNVLQL